MSTIERITITHTAGMAQTVRAAVQAGEYASSSGIVCEALRDRRHKRAQAQALGERRARVQEGLADIEAGRLHDFDAERIIEKGEGQLPGRVAGSRLDPGSLSARDTVMTALTLNLAEEKLQRLEVVAQARGASVAELFEEMSTVLLAEADAETRFPLRAERGAGREARGLELLRKCAGDVVEGQGI